MNAISANDTGLAAMKAHCSDVQTTALRLCGVIEAIEILDDAGAANAVSCLVRIARSLAEEVNNQLDSVNLPKGGAA